MIRRCLNWKVVGGLALVGAAVWLIAPGLLVAALPLLLLAACPLSMLVMMGAMGGTKSSHQMPPEQTSLVEESPGDTLANLTARLERVQAEQESLARTIAQLEMGGVGAVDAPEVVRAMVQPQGRRS